LQGGGVTPAGCFRGGGQLRPGDERHGRGGGTELQDVSAGERPLQRSARGGGWQFHGVGVSHAAGVCGAAVWSLLGRGTALRLTGGHPRSAQHG